ncbi:MAG TPA: DNA polymerase III subunit gamma/tau [Candidatus Atribacteria bacterium]|nr:DNA polymerase III subunit gamma/tau [Candidatus Atribacteria bacterium]
MTYRSLYRKWRPQVFEEIVGQEVASRLLTNALKSGQINHAYLFCGPRGVGKTTTARILARSVNCTQGITAQPCGICSSCLHIIEGNSLDCVEIDAASHRGIDDIRDLREKVKYSPIESRFKVYIIDEVHMLTTEAFNALLKTLEEPPDHAIFILATTEPHRLPDTILSRCLRINFNSIENEAIVQHLRKISIQEGFSIEESALYLIAQKSAGSLRDAVSFLEQLMSWEEKNITYEQATLVLREVDQSDLDALFFLLGKGDCGKVLLKANEWIMRGLEPEDIAHSLSQYFRSLLILSLIESAPPSGIAPQRIKILQEMVKLCSVIALRKTLQRLQGLELEIRRSSHPQILLELALLDIIDFLANQQQQSIDLTTSPEKALSKEMLIPEKKSPSPDSSVPNAQSVNTADNEWQTILQCLKKRKISLYAFLQEAELREATNSKLILAFGPNSRFHKESVERKENFQIIIDVLQEIRGKKCQLECVIDNSNSPDESEQIPSDEPVHVVPDNYNNNDTILTNKFESDNSQLKPFMAAVEIFGGFVVEYSAIDDHLRAGWEETDFEKSDEGSPENAG